MSEKTTYWNRKVMGKLDRAQKALTRKAFQQFMPMQRLQVSRKHGPGEGKCRVNVMFPNTTSVKKWMRWHRRFDDAYSG